ncbi:MAG: hypothetical protein ACRYGP_22025 [Janthinobacterium lividum]
MMGALWADIDPDMRLAHRHLGRAVEMLRSHQLDHSNPEDDTDEVAFKYRMLGGYTAFESALKRLLLMLDEEAPRGSQTHADLLRRFHTGIPGSRPALLDDKLYRAADELRKFRNVAIHVYDDLDLDRAALLVRDAEVFLAGIGPAFARFRTAIDPDEAQTPLA